MAHILANRGSLLVYRNWQKAFFSEKDNYETEYPRFGPVLGENGLKANFTHRVNFTPGVLGIFLVFSLVITTQKNMCLNLS